MGAAVSLCHCTQITADIVDDHTPAREVVEVRKEKALGLAGPVRRDQASMSVAGVEQLAAEGGGPPLKTFGLEPDVQSPIGAPYVRHYLVPPRGPVPHVAPP